MEPETFLQQLNARRRLEQTQRYTTAGSPSDGGPSADLSVPIRNRWLISPVLARSPFAPREAYVGEPDNDPRVVASWSATFHDSNFALFLGPESGVFSLGIDQRAAKQSLQVLFDGDGLEWNALCVPCWASLVCAPRLASTGAAQPCSAPARNRNPRQRLHPHPAITHLGWSP